jgi:hypothetical protein
MFFHGFGFEFGFNKRLVPTKRCDLRSMSQKPNLKALFLTMETETLITQVLNASISKVTNFSEFFQ